MTKLDSRVAKFQKFKLKYTPNCSLQRINVNPLKAIQMIDYTVNQPIQEIDVN